MGQDSRGFGGKACRSLYDGRTNNNELEQVRQRGKGMSGGGNPGSWCGHTTLYFDDRCGHWLRPADITQREKYTIFVMQAEQL